MRRAVSFAGKREDARYVLILDKGARGWAFQKRHPASSHMTNSRRAGDDLRSGSELYLNFAQSLSGSRPRAARSSSLAT